MLTSSSAVARKCIFVASLTIPSLLVACGFDTTDRWDSRPKMALETACHVGDIGCSAQLRECVVGASGIAEWLVLEDCPAQGKVCSSTLRQCVACIPNERSCDGNTVVMCDTDGMKRSVVETCATGLACRTGYCTDLCATARAEKSNVGCEYWGVDLDNANIDPTSNAAAQQYAIVVSNPQPDVPAEVIIEQDDGEVGSAIAPTIAAKATIHPGNLHTFKLGPREVDGSPPGEFNTGAGTAHTRAAFRITSSVPVVAFQFNPLENVNVFSNDASLLKPVESVSLRPGSNMDLQYVAVGWPQTIALTNDPNTNFGSRHLRAFLTVVGTRDNTRVRVTPSTHVVAGLGIPATTPGNSLEVLLQPFEVLNLETGDFNADFTGSLIEADRPVIAFTGSEASDAPYFSRLADRFCCADHLEEQLDPIRTAGRRFFAPHVPNRSQAIRNAGATMLGVVEEPEVFRLMSVGERPVRIRTTLPAPDDIIDLPGRGAHFDIRHHGDFYVEADGPITLLSVPVSQAAAGIPTGLPGGDPSIIIIPPIEQYRSDYVFLTPDKYMFDFVIIVAPTQAAVRLDGRGLSDSGCERAAADGLTATSRGSSEPPAWVYRCPLSFPVVLPDVDPPNNVLPGIQNDGVHTIEASQPVLALVYGFDNYVSYGYAAGTQLTEIFLW